MPRLALTAVVLIAATGLDLVDASGPGRVVVLAVAAVVVGLAVTLREGLARLVGRLSGASRRRTVRVAALVLPPLWCVGIVLRGTVPAEGWIAAAILMAAAAAVGVLMERSGVEYTPAVVASFILAQLAWIALQAGQGTLAVVREGRAVEHGALFLGSGLATLVLGVAWGDRSVAARWTCGLGGAALVAADRLLLVGLHPPVHMWAFGVGVVAAAGAISHRDGSSRLTGAAVVVMAIAGLVAGRELPSDVLARTGLARARLGRLLLPMIPATEVAVDASAQARLDHPRWHDQGWTGEAPNLVLVTIDTLRADVLDGSWEAPNLQRLAHEGTSFRRAYAPAPATSLSMPALMAGVYPAHLDWSVTRWDVILADRPAFLAERLAAAGYRTVGVTHAGPRSILDRGTGFEAGFHDYEPFAGEDMVGESATTVVAHALASLPQSDGDAPWFLWVHLWDTHDGGTRRGYQRLLTVVDTAVGELRAGLAARHDSRAALVFVTGDHGEALGEHGYRGHASALYEEQVRVPFVIWGQPVPRRGLETPVSTLDANATLLALAGADLDGIEGVNLIPVLLGQEAVRRPVFMEHRAFLPGAGRVVGHQVAVVDGRWKLIWDRLAVSIALFDLGDDPGERVELADDQEPRARDLLGLLRAFVN